jgi:carboxyl-terminal processing protease
MLPNDPAPQSSSSSGTGAADPGAPATGPATSYVQPPVAIQAPPTAGPGAVRRGPSILAIAVAVVALLAGSALFMSGVLVGERLDAQPGTPTSRADQFQPFWDTYQAIEDRYAGGDVDQQALIRGAIRGMVESLDDPYSAYLTPEEYQSGLQDLSGQFEGIGAEIGTRSASGQTSQCATLGADCVLIVVSPIDGSPAQKAGLVAGDAILKIDGAGLGGLTVDAARNKVRGKKGTTVVLTIGRGSAAPFEVPIVRDVIVQKEVTTKNLANGAVGYIHVNGFSDNSASQFHDALRPTSTPARRRSSSTSAATRRLRDGRRRIASEFIGPGRSSGRRTPRAARSETDASSGGLATSDKVSSSSSTRAAPRRAQIVAGALQDSPPGAARRRRPFGKEHGPAVDRLQDNGALKLTIAKWLTPTSAGSTTSGSRRITSAYPVDRGQDPQLGKAVET